MGFTMTTKEFNDSLEKLKETYDIYGPKRFVGEGRFCDTDIIRYARVDRVEEIVFDEKSHYGPKEVFSPLTETLFYFADGEYREKKGPVKKMLLIGRACDINAIKRYDDIYLKNGGYVDEFYKKVRENVEFAVIECPKKGWDTCFCKSMGTNKAEKDEYLFSVKYDNDKVLVDENKLDGEYFSGEVCSYEISFVEENYRDVSLPEIPNKDIQKQVKNLEFWKRYDKRCVKCGSCTVACSTCTCYTAYDMEYTPDSNAGERRRINASCHIDGYTDMAGGHTFRPSAGERMRFKTMHKIHDHKKRFGHNMCVGCGRCDDRCPAFISFSTLINDLTKECKKLVGGDE